MAIVKMKRLHLIGMGSDREAILRALQGMGCVQIDAPSGPRAEEVSQQLRRPDTKGLSVRMEQCAQVERALTTLKRYAPQKGGLLRAKPRLTARELLDTQRESAAWERAEEINAAQRRIQAIQAEQAKLQTQQATLQPWAGLELPLETHSTPQLTIQLGTLPAAIPFQQVQEDVRQSAQLCQLTQISAGRELQYLLVVSHASQWQSVLEQLRQLGWARTQLREWTGTAAENIQTIRRQLAQLDQELQHQQQALAAMGDTRGELEWLADYTAVQLGREQAKARLLDSRQTFYLEGWVPSPRWEQMELILQAYPCAYQVSDPAPEDYDSVPVQLKNNWLTQPLNMVTEMYSLPRYGSLDPNPLMAPFFILFYGIMMADMGYGILMILSSILVLKKVRPKQGSGMYNLFALMGLGGVSTFIMGMLTCGFFGDFIPQLLRLINPESTFEWFWAPLFTPLDDTIMILIGSMALGFVQINTGMAISFYKKLRDKAYLDALWEEVTWWVVFAGIACVALGVGTIGGIPVVLTLGGVMVVVGGCSSAKGVLGKFSAVVGSLYNHVTGYFGDILSYSRLMALMLAGSVIAMVFNTLGAIPGNIFIFVVVSMFGNMLNFALNLLGCYVHDLRLQCLEFFGKFYQDGGKPFQPLHYNTTYTTVEGNAP